jgi:ATP-dependent helicase/nuclease subunit A
LSHDTEYLINLIYHKFRNQLDQTDLVYRAYNESLAILEAPELSFLFNNDNSLREVPIAGNISLQDMTDNNSEKGRWIKGRIDLLNITATQILIVDFKTNYNVPKSVEVVSSLISSQLELYTLLLEQAYPNHEVSAAILWTHQAQLMKIPRDITQSALNTIFINQVLDDV